MYKISFIGIGKLGQSCAEMIAERYDVVGYDIFSRNPANFAMVESIEKAVIGRDIIFVAVETPHESEYDGCAPTSHLPVRDFNYSIVSKVLDEVNVYSKPHQTVVLISTVLPGTIRDHLSYRLTNATLIYNPYLIAMGTVKWDMVNPELLILGNQSGMECVHTVRLADFYTNILENSPQTFLGTWEEAECLKVFYNTFISAKVSLVNMIQDVAERLGNVDSGHVCRALATSSRRIMGPAYMTPGMGDGGACHPRDNIALRYMALRLKLGYDLFDAVMYSREEQAKNMATFISETGGKMPVVIVGKAYKPLVPYCNGSSSMLVGHYLTKLGEAVHYFDEQVGEFPPEDLGPAKYLLAHNPEVTYGSQLDLIPEWYNNKHEITAADSALTVSTAAGTKLSFPQGSIVIDPWRRVPLMRGIRVIHYGNTRRESPR